MSDQKIVTQGNLRNLNFLLDVVASNLQEHANATLSKAHGINLEPGFVDEEGNDRTSYRDSGGNIVGNRQLRIPVDGTIYYLPAKDTALSGQAETTGAIDVSGTSAAAGEEATAWVTRFTEEATAVAESANEILIEHTRQQADEAHTDFQVVQEPVVDSSGHTVGRVQLRIIASGLRYALPADERVGGPPQGIRATVSPTVGLSKGQELPLSAVDYTYVVTGGTLPYTAVWQVNDQSDGSSPTWIDLTGDDGVVHLDTPTFVLNYYNADTNVLGVRAAGIGDIDDRVVSPAFTLRVKFTNEMGVSYSPTVILQGYDKSGKSIIFSSSYIADFLTRRQLLDILAYRIRVQAKDRWGRETWAGYMVLFHPVAMRILKGDWVSRVLFNLFPRPFYRYAMWRMGKEPFRLGCWVVSKLFEAASLATYFIRHEVAEYTAKCEEQRGSFSQYIRKVERKKRLRYSERQKGSAQPAQAQR